mgnify:CR=1 FL=1
MIRNLDYQITKKYDSILQFFEGARLLFQPDRTFEKTPESILKNGIWSYVNKPLHTGDLLHIHIEENEALTISCQTKCHSPFCMKMRHSGH